MQQLDELFAILGLAVESFRQFEPGRVGAVAGAPLTLANYLELASPSFAGVLIETFEISIAASLLGVAIAFPIAFCMVRRFSPRVPAQQGAALQGSRAA